MGADVTIVGGGLGGLGAAVAAAGAGRRVELLEAKADLGGRARTAVGPYRANWGPHVVYSDGAFWRWLDDRHLTGGVHGARGCRASCCGSTAGPGAGRRPASSAPC